jgi:hypothetical protein
MASLCAFPECPAFGGLVGGATFATPSVGQKDKGAKRNASKNNKEPKGGAP